MSRLIAKRAGENGSSPRTRPRQTTVGERSVKAVGRNSFYLEMRLEGKTAPRKESAAPFAADQERLRRRTMAAQAAARATPKPTGDSFELFDSTLHTQPPVMSTPPAASWQTPTASFVDEQV